MDLPREGVSDEVLLELTERIEELASLEQQIREKVQKIAELRAKCKSALNSVGVSLDPETWKGIDLRDIGRLEDFLLDAQQTISEKQFLETEINQFAREIANKKDVNSDQAKHGIRILSSWLQEQRESGGVPTK